MPAKQPDGQRPPRALYRTPHGVAYAAPAEDVLATLPESSIDLVVTSPPFALLREKEYGNLAQDRYVDWLASFGPLVRRVLKDTGSFVLDLGGAYRRGVPVRSLHNYRLLLRLCDESGFHLAQEFFWHNPAKLPSPIEWVNKRKIRTKDSVNTIWWLSKTEWPRADVRNVLTAYSPRMKRLLAAPERFYEPKTRPSGHAVSLRFASDNGGAIPSNLLWCANTESNSLYLRLCKHFGVVPHPARFPEMLPEFFIRFLTEPGDTVMDCFAGSNTTGSVAEALGRKWVAVEVDEEYLTASAFRFFEGRTEVEVADYLRATVEPRNWPVHVAPAGATPSGRPRRGTTSRKATRSRTAKADSTVD